MAGAVSQARSGKGQFILVSGEAGIGKTTLVEELITREGGSCRFLRGYCDPMLTPSALGPLRDIEREIGEDPQGASSDGANRADKFNQLLERLNRIPQSVALVFEDIHWADEATIDLLRFLGRRIEDTRIVLVATFRDDEVPRHDALHLLLGELSTNGNVIRVALGRLGRESVARLAGESIEDVDQLYEVTGGNPFYVTEVIASLPSGLPATVRDAVLGRAVPLEPNDRRFLDLSAVIGARVDYALLEHIEAIDETALARCTATGLLQAGERYATFRHELARVAILEAIDPLRRRALSRDVLHAAERAGFERDNQFARLSHYAESAGLGEKVVRYGTKAGRMAASVGAHREAAAHFKSVIRFSHDRSAPERAQSFVEFANETAVVDRLPEAIDAYREAIELYDQSEDRFRKGDTLAICAWPLVRHGDNAEAEAAVQEAVTLLEPFGPTRELANAYRTKAHLRMLDRDLDTAVNVGTQAIEMAREVSDASTLAEAEMTVGAAMLVADNAKGKEHLDQCIKIARDNRLDEVVALARMNLGSAYGEQYRFDQAEAELQKGLAFCAEHDLDHSANYMRSWLALTRVFQGRLREGAEISQELLKQPNLAQISRIMVLVALGRILVRTGETGASDVLEEALLHAQKTGTLQRLAPIHAARAEMAWFAGDLDQVEIEARSALDLARSRKHVWHVGEFRYWLKLYGSQNDIEDWIAKPYALQIAGDWQAAAAIWRDRGCPFEEARALAEGDHDAKIRALAIFDTLGAKPAAAALRRDMRRSGLVRIPRGPRASTKENRFGLTRREMTVLNHLVLEQSNTEIAEKLFISPKTVDHHVSSILQKLGVKSRGDAATIAAREGLCP